MTNVPHAADLLLNVPDAPPSRAQLLPGWVKAVAFIILLFSLLILYGLLIIALAFVKIDGITVPGCIAIGLFSGISTVGLMLERRWALPLAVWSSVCVVCVFTGLLVYDLFFYHHIIWTMVFIECGAITITAFYLRALWKVRHAWKVALPEATPARRFFK